MRLREDGVVEPQRIIFVRHRQHHPGADHRATAGVCPEQRLPAERTAGDRHHDCRRRSRPRIVEGEQPQQHLLPEGRVAASALHLVEPARDALLEGRAEDAVTDEARLEDALELRVGSRELLERLAEHGV